MMGPYNMLALGFIIILLVLLFLREKLPAQFRGYLPYGVAILSVVVKVSFSITWGYLSPSLLLIFFLSLYDEKLKNEVILYPLVFVSILPNSETLLPILIAFSFVLINYLTKLKSVSSVSGIVVFGLCLLIPYFGFEGNYPFILLLPLVLLLLSFNELSQILIVCFVMSQKFFLTTHPDMVFSIALVSLLSLFRAKKIVYSILPSLILASWSPVENRIIFFLVAVLSIDTVSRVAKLLFDSIHYLEISNDGKFLISKEHGMLWLLALWAFSGTKFSLGSFTYFLEVDDLWRNLSSLAILISVVFLPIFRSNTFFKEEDIRPSLVELFLKSIILAVLMSFLIEPGVFGWGQFLGGVLLVGVCVLIKVKSLSLIKLNMILCKSFISVPKVNFRNDIPHVIHIVFESKEPTLPMSKRRALGIDGLGPTFIFVLTTLLILIVYIGK